VLVRGVLFLLYLFAVVVFILVGLFIVIQWDPINVIFV